MARTVLVVAVVLIVIGVLAAWFLRKPPAVAACADTHPRVVAFGDSLVKGYGAPAGQDFVSVLARQTDTAILNLGASGDTTAAGLLRVDQVITAQPDIVLVLLGGNDALQQVPLAKTEENLDAILQRILSYQRKPVKVILVGVLGGFPTDPYAPMFERLAKKYQVTYVPNILSGVITDPNLMSDQVHPNAAGYAKIANRLTPILEQVCSTVHSQ